jgi:hypothetical protein
MRTEALDEGRKGDPRTVILWQVLEALGKPRLDRDGRNNKMGLRQKRGFAAVSVSVSQRTLI